MAETITILFVVLMWGATLLGSLLFLYGISVRILFRRASKKFFNEFERRLDMGVIKKLEDVTEIQQSISDEMDFPSFGSEDLGPLLRFYLMKIDKKNKRRFKFVRSLVKQSVEEKPFAILPDKERALALRLQENIGKNKEALNQLLELATSLGEKLQSERKASQRTRNWTIAGAIAGIIGVIITVTLLI